MRRKVGIIGVDAGLCWIGDPSYILHGEQNDDLGENWDEFCDLLVVRQTEGATQFNFSKQYPGLGVCVQTGQGDGMYPVYAEYGKDGTITRVSIDFTDGEHEG